jgi:UDP-N-acetylglucosamine 2-epimerase (non-hydrolysing)
MPRKRFLICFGTRPEAVKLFPLVKKLRENTDVDVIVCATGQHREMLDQVLKVADIFPEVDLDVMRPNQSLEDLTASLLLGICQTIDKFRPTRIIVQGDTTTAMAGSLASYYRKVPLAHVEAGLRSHNIMSPWPEEVNRKIISSVADMHFAPTKRAAESLMLEGVPEDSIHVTGNTVVDALLFVREYLATKPAPVHHWKNLDDNKNIILATCHRRENFGQGIVDVANAFNRIAARPDVKILLPVHPNPNVADIFHDRLKRNSNIILLKPLSYVEFVELLNRSKLVLTDSGGIQEEAPTFGKPVLVMRNTTERPEGIDAGTAKLVGTDENLIVTEAHRLLDDVEYYNSMSQAHNPYGDGLASQRISSRLLELE